MRPELRPGVEVKIEGHPALGAGPITTGLDGVCEVAVPATTKDGRPIGIGGYGPRIYSASSKMLRCVRGDGWGKLRAPRVRDEVTG